MKFLYKRIFDLTLALCGLIVLLPVFIIIAFLVKCTSKGSVFFCQRRIGRFGEPFTIYKFRTMKPNPSLNTISIRGDERITPIGRILRKYKLDELPELLNIITGNMSFVGPRPDVSGYADKLTGEDGKVLLLKPGITSPASLKYIDEEEILAKIQNPVKYNNEVIYPDKVRLNKLYYDNWSLLLDIKVIWGTIFRQKYNEAFFFKLKI